jgi:hypothetical protein
VRLRAQKPAYTIGMHDDSPADTVHGGNALLYMMTEGCGEASGRWKTKSGVPPVFEVQLPLPSPAAPSAPTSSTDASSAAPGRAAAGAACPGAACSSLSPHPAAPSPLARCAA